MNTPATIRAQRAAEQANNYGLFAHSAGNVFSVISRSGNVYETTTETCSCPDFTQRGSKATPPVACKHQHLVREEAAKKANEAAKVAAIRARIEIDFPACD